MPYLIQIFILEEHETVKLTKYGRQTTCSNSLIKWQIDYSLSLPWQHANKSGSQNLIALIVNFTLYGMSFNSNAKDIERKLFALAI